jgi:outer membrane protein assembly factor BamB
MPRALRWILLAVSVLVIAIGGVLLAIGLTNNETRGALDTELEDVTVSVSTKPRKPTKTPKPTNPKLTSDQRCWTSFGGDPARSLARPNVDLGLPSRKILWTRGLKSYIEYPPSYCEGTLYVNSFEGNVFAIDAETGKVRWRRSFGGTKPSTPAIAGPRLFVSSRDGTVTALDRDRGRRLWQVRTGGKVESSPVVVDGLVYFGSTAWRLFAVRAQTGRVRWAYDTGGRINSSPSVYGRRVCNSTYAGSIF